MIIKRSILIKEGILVENYKKELIEGFEIRVLPARTVHSNIVMRIYDKFNDYIRNNNIECVVYPDNLYLFIDKKNRVSPDIMVICDIARLTEKGYEGVPELVVEVLSRSTEKMDTTKKLQIYEQLGIKEYWIVDPVSRTIKQFILKDNKYELEDIYYEDVEEDIEDDEYISKDSFNTYIFPKLEIKVKDLFKHKNT